ncbi:helix-turn-helix transcriptional regulator [Brevundimonas sp.]|uniref:helix-turn-helix domain-containing protein n=1 Tax=Brevundimonas sp. TaxID=1871086 RepID=UPI0025B8FF53|nr:helix-turn-helix transcriptional regulator [Brevundimonas sp.]
MAEMAEDKEVTTRIAENINSRRAELGLSQAQLGDALRVSFQQVQKYLVGKNRVPSDKMPALAKVLRCSIGELYGTEETTVIGAERLLRAWGDLPASQREAITDLVEALAAQEHPS